MTHHKIINGDSRQMNLLASKSVHLVVTSPLIGSSKIMEQIISLAFTTVTKITSTTLISCGKNAIGYCNQVVGYV